MPARCCSRSSAPSRPGPRPCTVVDEDVDIYDMNDVMWAILTRSRPDRDVMIIPETPSFYRDPHKDHWGRLGIDATAPFDRRARVRAQASSRAPTRVEPVRLFPRSLRASRSDPDESDGNATVDRRAGRQSSWRAARTQAAHAQGAAAPQEDHLSHQLRVPRPAFAVLRRGGEGFLQGGRLRHSRFSRRPAAASSSPRSTAARRTTAWPTSAPWRSAVAKGAKIKSFMVFTDVTTSGLASALSLSDPGVGHRQEGRRLARPTACG